MAQITDDFWNTLILAAVVFGVAMFGGYFPLVVTSGARAHGNKKQMLLYLNALSGGVLLSAGFTHLLPDSTANLEDDHWFGSLPVGFVLASMSFVVLLLVEHATVLYMRGQETKVPCHVHGYGSGGTHENDGLRVSPMAPGGSVNESRGEHGHHHGNHDDPAGTQLGAADGDAIKCTNALVMFVSLGVHSLLEGLGLGASEGLTQFGLFLAIVTHKGLAALALGTSFVQAHVSKSQFHLLIWAFSLATPLGALCGALLADASEDSAAASYCTALAAGTFLFVACMEIIPDMLRADHEGSESPASRSTSLHSTESLHRHVHACEGDFSIRKMSCMPFFLTGYLIMTILSAYV